TSGQNSAAADGYRRAMSACLEARGYAVHYRAAARPAPPPPPPAEPVRAKRSYAAAEPKNRPLQVQIHAGYTPTVGTTDLLMEGGGNGGLGLIWYPSSELPLALRVDGSYSRFETRREFRNLYGPDFTSGHDNIYGGDADLQLDLAHRSPWVKMYLFGGAGW